jgi:hypothetical protein
MKCFVHRDDDAIGTCRVCSRGLCFDCAVDHSYALSCRGSCESEAKLLRSQTIASMTLLSAQKRYKNFLPAFFGVAGILFMVTSFSMRRISWFIVAIGATFIGFGVVAYLANRRWVKVSSSDGA